MIGYVLSEKQVPFCCGARYATKRTSDASDQTTYVNGRLMTGKMDGNKITEKNELKRKGQMLSLNMLQEPTCCPKALRSKQDKK